MNLHVASDFFCFVRQSIILLGNKCFYQGKKIPESLVRWALKKGARYLLQFPVRKKGLACTRGNNGDVKKKEKPDGGTLFIHNEDQVFHRHRIQRPIGFRIRVAIAARHYYRTNLIKKI